MTNVNSNGKTIFSPPIISWAVAIVIGIVLPLFLQDVIASQIANLGTKLPETADEIVIPNPALMLVASLVLFVIASFWVFALGLQIYYIATIKKISSIWPFFITILGPIFIWAIVPYALIVLAG